MNQKKNTVQKTRSASGYDLMPISQQKRDELASKLSPEERRVLLSHGTERPFCGGLLNNKEDGVYACRLCGLPLFNSHAKFESGTGWPSFFEPFDPDHISNIVDESYGMARTEIRCAVWEPSGPRISRRPGAHGPALLPEFRGTGIFC